MRRKNNLSNRRDFKAILLVLGWLLFLGIPDFVRAQESGGLSVSPAFVRTTIQEGQARETLSFKVSNRTLQEAEVGISLVDLGSLDESGGVPFLGNSGNSGGLSERYSLARWVKVQEPEVVLPAGSEKEIKLEVWDDSGLAPGGHYGAVLFRWQGSLEDGERQLGISPVISSIIFLSKEAGEIRGLELSSIDTGGSRTEFPRELKIGFDNAGNTHVVPRGIITIENYLGRTIFRSVLNQDSGLVLPENSRVFPIELKGLPKFLLAGRYKIAVDYRFDGKEEFSHSETHFWYFSPLQTGGMVLLTILLISAILYCFKHKCFLKGKSSQEYAQTEPKDPS